MPRLVRRGNASSPAWSLSVHAFDFRPRARARAYTERLAQYHQFAAGEREKDEEEKSDGFHSRN